MNRFANIRTRARAGFSLPEMLAVMLILTLASMIVAAGVPAAHKAYIGAVDSSNAQVLLTTTIESLRNELAAAEDPVITGLDEDEVVQFESCKTGFTTTIKNTSSGISIIKEKSDGIDSTGATTRTELLVPQAAGKGASGNLIAKITSLTLPNDGAGTVTSKDVFTISITVSNSAGTELGNVTDLKIRSLAES